MKNLNIKKAATIIKDPYLTNHISIFHKIIHKFNSFLELRKLEYYFSDFDEIYFPNQAKQIYDEVYAGVEKKQYPYLVRSLDENVFKFDQSDIFDGENILKLKNQLHKDTKSWKIVNTRIKSKEFDGANLKIEKLRMRDLSKEKSHLNNYIAQITLRYKYLPENKTKYIVYERNLFDNFNFYGWKITCTNYPH